MKRPFFITGCPRSGTTALWRLMIQHPGIIMGNERYSSLVLPKHYALTREHLRRTRFFALEDGDTFPDNIRRNRTYLDEQRNKLSTAVYLGDKNHGVITQMDATFASFPEARVLVLVRSVFEVAASYARRADDVTDSWAHDRRIDAAISDWNRAIRNALAWRHDPRVMIVDYQTLYRQGAGLAAILDFLALPPSDMFTAYFDKTQHPHALDLASKPIGLTGAEHDLILHDADLAASTALLSGDTGPKGFFARLFN